MLLVQGRMVGKEQFAFAGKQTELGFGSDPQVRGTRIMERKQEGEEGILQNKQKIVWHYRFDLVNGKDHPVQVRLEETKPESRHEDIHIDCASPGYELHTKDDTLFWDLRMQAGENMSVPFQVTVTAPEEMDIFSPR